jgi:hypothetical protein
MKYRECADECLGWAKTAKSERERAIFLQMAVARQQAAAIAEGRSMVLPQLQDARSTRPPPALAL